MRIAIEVAGFTPAESDGFRRAMGTWRSSHEMEKLHRRSSMARCASPAWRRRPPRSCSARSRRSPSFGFAKSHAAAFARTAYESSFLKLFYPAQFLVGLINAQPMGFYPVEVLVNDAKRHGVAVLPVDINASSYKTTTEWVGTAGRAAARGRRDHRSTGAGPVAGLRHPVRRGPRTLDPEVTAGWGVRLGLHLVKGIGEQHAALLDARTGARAVRVAGRCRRADRASRGGPRAAHPDGWRWTRWVGRDGSPALATARGRRLRGARRHGSRSAATVGSAPMDLRLPATEAPTSRRSPSRSGSGTPTRSSGWTRGAR